MIKIYCIKKKNNFEVSEELTDVGSLPFTWDQGDIPAWDAALNRVLVRGLKTALACVDVHGF